MYVCRKKKNNIREHTNCKKKSCIYIEGLCSEKGF